MDQHESWAIRYRNRAEELRVTARYTRDHNAQKVLLEVAADYERLAELQESLAAISSGRRID